MSLEKIIKTAKNALIGGSLLISLTGCSIIKLAFDITDTLASTAVDTVDTVVPWTPNPQHSSQSTLSPPSCSFYETFNFKSDKYIGYSGYDSSYARFNYLNKNIVMRLNYPEDNPNGVFIKFCYTPISEIQPGVTAGDLIYKYCKTPIFLQPNIPQVIAKDMLFIYRANYSPSFSEVGVVVTNCPQQ